MFDEVYQYRGDLGGRGLDDLPPRGHNCTKIGTCRAITVEEMKELFHTMSYIDTFDHEFVGFFGGLPLYHPLEKISGTDNPDEFACGPDQLILSGGSGEHPALLLNNPPAAVLHFFALVLHMMKAEDKISETSIAVLDNTPSASEILTFAGWSLRQLAAFHQRCIAPAYQKPYSEEFGDVETWLVSSLGEFVYFSMRELLSQQAHSTFEHLEDVRALVRRPFLYNVTTPAPGFPVSAGRHRDSRGNVIWGNYKWQSIAP